MADPREYLASLSEHPDRAGDTAYLNPDFASKLATAVQQARGQGLPIGVMSAFREPGQTGSTYDAGGNSSHSYGLASDISGLDGPNGRITQQWAQIAQANGLHNPYGTGDAAEFNHWQLPSTPLEQQPNLLAALKAAKATGNVQNVWNAWSSGGEAPTSGKAVYTAQQLFDAIYGQESNFGKAAPTNPMQIQPGTWAQYAHSGEDINNPSDNRAVGLRMITDYMNKYANDPGRVATAYFSGTGNVAPMAFKTPFLEDKNDASGKRVSSYVQDIMGRLGAPTGSGQLNAPIAQPQTAAPPNMGSMLGQALAGMSAPAAGGGDSLNNAMMAQAAPPAPGPQLAFRAAADDAAQASNLTAGSPSASGAVGEPGTGAAGMTGLLGLMADPNAQSPITTPTDVPMVGMSGLLYGGGAGLGVRHPAVTRLT